MRTSRFTEDNVGMGIAIGCGIATLWLVCVTVWISIGLAG